MAKEIQNILSSRADNTGPSRSLSYLPSLKKVKLYAKVEIVID